MSGSDFMELSDANRTSFKWELFLVPLKLSLAIMLPTLDRKMFSDIYQEIVKHKGNKGTIINQVKILLHGIETKFFFKL